MEQKDYFQRQIDQLGKALANVLSKLMNKGYSGSAADRMEIIDQVLTNSLNLNMHVLSEKDDEGFIDFLLNQLRISPNNLEDLSETMIIYADSFKNSQSIYKKVLIILKHLRDISTDYSFEREMKIKELENKTV